MSHLHLRANKKDTIKKKQGQSELKSLDWTPAIASHSGLFCRQPCLPKPPVFSFAQWALGLISLGALHMAGARVTACVPARPHTASGEFRQHELICQQRAGLAPGPWQARAPRARGNEVWTQAFVNASNAAGQASIRWVRTR